MNSLILISTTLFPWIVNEPSSLDSKSNKLDQGLIDDRQELIEYLEARGASIGRSSRGVRISLSDDWAGSIDDWEKLTRTARDAEPIELDIEQNVIVDKARLDALANRADGFVHIFFGGHKLDREAILSLRQFVNLEMLWLSGLTKDLDAVNDVVSHLRKLQNVSLPYTSTDETIAILAAHGTVESLYCPSENLTVASVEALARCPNLEKLYLEYTNLRGRDFRSLQMHESLREFRVPRKCRDEDMVEIARLSRVENLIVDIEQFGLRGLRHVVGMPRLKSLTVEDGEFSEEAFDLLMQCESLEELRLVDCGDIDLSDLREFAHKYRQRYERELVVLDRRY